MNRRKFLHAIGAATMAAGISGCNSENTRSGSQNVTDGKMKADNAVHGPCITPSASQADVASHAAMLTVFMLCSTQRTADCAYLSEAFFPDDGRPKIAGNDAIQRWGFDPTATVQRITANSPLSPKQIRDTFNAVHDMFTGVAAYGGPDCPGPMSIRKIVSTAANVTES